MGNAACCRARSATVASSPPRIPDWTEVVPLFREGVRGHPTVDDRYVSKGTLGSGGFGVVWLAVSRSSEPGPRWRVACKSIRWSNLRKPEAVEDLRRELSIMASLSRQHPAMVRLHEVYEDEGAVHLVMDLCDGVSLSDRMVIIHRLTACTETLERAAARVAWELVEAVRALHAAGIMHRDLKSDNLMFSGHGDEERLKVIDFGFAVDFRPGETFTDEVGSFPYMAPEVFARSYGPEADVWSAGVVVYQLLCGRHPFPAHDKTYKAQRKATLRGAADMERHPWPLISGGAKDLVRRMLEPDKTRRPTALELLEHPWLKAEAIASEAPASPGLV